MGRNHPNLRSVNAAFFDAFLSHLLEYPDLGGFSTQPLHRLKEILREAALREALKRVAARRGWPPGWRASISMAYGGKVVNSDRGGENLQLTAEEKILAAEEALRLTRGMPRWLLPLWEGVHERP